MIGPNNILADPAAKLKRIRPQLESPNGEVRFLGAGRPSFQW
jgi:hypothetical protein